MGGGYFSFPILRIKVGIVEAHSSRMYLRDLITKVRHLITPNRREDFLLEFTLNAAIPGYQMQCPTKYCAPTFSH